MPPSWRTPPRARPWLAARRKVSGAFHAAGRMFNQGMNRPKPYLIGDVARFVSGQPTPELADKGANSTRIGPDSSRAEPAPCTKDEGFNRGHSACPYPESQAQTPRHPVTLPWQPPGIPARSRQKRSSRPKASALPAAHRPKACHPTNAPGQVPRTPHCCTQFHDGKHRCHFNHRHLEPRQNGSCPA